MNDMRTRKDAAAQISYAWKGSKVSLRVDWVVIG